MDAAGACEEVLTGVELEAAECEREAAREEWEEEETLGRLASPLSSTWDRDRLGAVELALLELSSRERFREDESS